MSWGYRVTILCAGFALFMLFLVASAFRQNFDLVAEDYYGRELKFQEQIEKQKNQAALGNIKFEIQDEKIVLTFPGNIRDEHATGKITFFRPSDKNKDFTIELLPDRNNQQEISKSSFINGLYKVQIEYEMNGRGYYSEESLMIY